MKSSKIESLGVYVPENVVTSEELLESFGKRFRWTFDRYTGIKERRFAGEMEFSLDMAANACEDALANSSHKADDIDLIISCSITKSGNDRHIFHYEPSMSSLIKQRIGAGKADNFDVTNACAGMFTGVMIMDSLIRSGAVKRGIVTSGEVISDLSKSAVVTVKSLFDEQLASLTLGDGGAAVIMESSESGYGFNHIDMVTVAEFGDLCVSYPSQNGAGAMMTTDASGLYKNGLEIQKRLIHDVIERTGWKFEEIDAFISHQTSKRAIRNGAKGLNKLMKVKEPKVGVEVVDRYGNTASTSHFLALHHALKSGEIKKDDRLMFLVQASGIVIGHSTYVVDDLVERISKDKGLQVES